jgi:hypothetical protein
VRIGKNAGSDDLPLAQRLGFGLLLKQIDQVAKGDERASKHVGPYAAILQLFALEEPCFDVRQFFGVLERNRSSDHEATVETVVRRAIRNSDFPIGMVALHDLHRVCHPLYARKQFRHFARAGDPLELERDLGLDARLREATELDARPVFFRLNQRAVVDRAPHRLVDAVALPERAVRESDLAPERLPALRDAMRVQRTRAGVARFRREARIALAEARHDRRGLMHTH